MNDYGDGINLIEIGHPYNSKNIQNNNPPHKTNGNPRIPTQTNGSKKELIPLEEAIERQKRAMAKGLAIGVAAGILVSATLGVLGPKFVEEYAKNSEQAKMADQVRIVYVKPYEDRGNIQVKEIAKKISESGDIDLVLYFLRMRCNINTLNAIIKEVTGCENLEEYVTNHLKYHSIDDWIKAMENRALGVKEKNKVPEHFDYKYIDFDAIDKMFNPPQEESSGFSDDYLNKIIEENMAATNESAAEAGKGGTKR